MKLFLTFLSSVLLPLACVGAPSYTTYFNNTHTYTNASVGGSIFVGPDTLNYWGPPTATDVLISISTNQIQRHLVAATYNAAGKGAKWDIDTRFHEANEILSAESDGHGNSAISFQVRTNFVIVDIASSETSSANFGIYTDQSGVIQMELEVANSALAGFYPTVADGASAVAYLFDTRDALSTAGAKLASFKNDGSEKFSIAHDGSITASGSALVNSITATNGGTFRGEIVSTLGTITADASALDATATWNNAGVTFTGLKLNITDTASAAASLLMDLQLAGVSQFKVRKNGTVTANNYVVGGDVGLDSTTIYGPRLALGTAFTADTILLRDAANTLAMRNGTAAQEWRVYNTFTDSSNYERAIFAWSGNVFTIGSSFAGTGSRRDVKLSGLSTTLTTGGTDRWTVNSSGHLLAGADNTYDIGASGATRPRNYFGAGTIESAGTITTSNGSIVNSSSGSYQWASRARLYSPANSIILLQNAAANDFDRLQFGGTTASFPALKRSTTELQVRLADDSADAPLKSGQLSNTGIRVMTPSSLQTLAAANALLANATKVRVVGSGGAVTLTSTPTIADGSDGQYVMIQGTDDTNTLTVQDQGSLASSNLELGAASRVLGAGDVLVLTFDTTASVWYEVSFANN